MAKVTTQAQTTTKSSLLASHPIAIYESCDKLFEGEPWLQWEPETIVLKLRKEISDLEVDKLLAVQSLACNPEPALNMGLAFEKTVMAFCNNVCVMDTWQPPYVEEMCYAVPQMLGVLRLSHGSQKYRFDGEVPGYVASVAKYRGWIALPRRLGFANQTLRELNGLTEKSPKYKENADLITAVHNVCKELDKPTAEKILASEQYKALDEVEQIQFTKIAGAVLFDPTVIYK